MRAASLQNCLGNLAEKMTALSAVLSPNNILAIVHYFITNELLGGILTKQISSPPARWGSLHFNKVATPLPLLPPPSPPPLLLPACRHCGHRPTRISQQVQKLLANSSSVCAPGPYRELQLSLGTDPNICQTESECQNRSQIERHKRCQIECQSKCQKGYQNICHNICQLVEITRYHAARKKNAQCEGVIFSFNMAMDQKPGILVNINIVGTSRQMFMPKYGIGWQMPMPHMSQRHKVFRSWL